MSLLDGLRHRLSVLRRGQDYARETEQEIRFHMELARLAQSVGSANKIDAELRAKHQLGNTTYYREEVRRMTLQAWVDRILQDAVYAIRGLNRSRGFTAAVVLTLALGIGVNAAMFSLLDRIFLEPPAGVVHPEGIRRVYLNFVNGSRSAGRLSWPFIQYPQFRALRSAVDSRIALGIYSSPDSSALRDGNARISVRYSRVNPEYFTVVGIHAQAGRLFSNEESDIATPTPVVVLSDAFWRRAFDGDRKVIGRRFMLGKQQFTVIGIAPPDFTGLDIDAVDLWVPANTYEGSGGGMPGPWYNTFGASFKLLLRPGSNAREDRLITLGTAAIQPVQIAGLVYDPTIHLESGPVVEALGPAARGTEVKIATRVAGVALIVLIIACANVTNLLLLRAARRKREIAVRRALGVSRGRLIEQLTVESLTLALCGGAVALVFSFWATTALRRLVLPRVHWGTPAVGASTVAFTVLVATVIGLLAGLPPALQSMRTDLVESLKAGMRGSAYRGSGLRAILLTVQAALCLVLLIGSGLFVRSLDNVQSIGVGYDPSNQVFLRPLFDDPEAHSGELRAAYPAAAKRLATIEGVEAVAYSSVPPMQGASFRMIYLPGHEHTPQLPGDYGPSMDAVSAGFFKASGLTIRSGRDFSDGDTADGQQVIIVGASMAQLYWPGESPIGKCFMILKKDGPCYAVVGVVADAHRMRIIEGPISQFYVPLAQWKDAHRALIVRTRPGREAAVTRAAEEIFRPLVSGMIGMSARSLVSVMEPELAPWRLGATLFTALGLLALAVAAIGVYSVVAFGVSERLNEMGIRIALGARVRDILNLVLADGLRTVAIGIVIGGLVALGLGRLVTSLLFGVLPNDPSIFIGATVVLGLVGMIACLIPGWRAANVSPAEALRAD
jgi:putative ABC transport system permease protein